MSYAAPKYPWWVVARREVLAKVSDKAFWLSTIFTLAIIAVAMAISFLFASDNKMSVGVADETATKVVQLADQLSERQIIAQQIPADQLEQAIKDDKVSAGLARTETGWQLVVKSVDTNTGDLQKAISVYTTSENAAKLGINTADLERGSEVEVKLAGDRQTEQSGAAIIAGFVFAILFMMSTMTYGIQVAQSVAEEKESRLVEILVSAVSVRDLLIGKLIGNTIMALGQLLLFIIVAVIGLSFTPYGHLLPMLAPGIGWFIVFFVAGFAALGCLWAAAGAMASRVQDTSNTTAPLTMIVILAYMAGFTARGAAAKVLSFVPVVSTVTMPQRVITGEATWWEAVIALLICFAFMFVTIRLGSYIYRRGLMKTGGIMKLKEVFAKQEA